MVPIRNTWILLGESKYQLKIEGCNKGSQRKGANNKQRLQFCLLNDLVLAG